MNLAETQMMALLVGLKSIPFDYIEAQFQTRKYRMNKTLLLRIGSPIANLIQSEFPDLWADALSNPRTWRLRDE